MSNQSNTDTNFLVVLLLLASLALGQALAESYTLDAEVLYTKYEYPINDNLTVFAGWHHGIGFEYKL